MLSHAVQTENALAYLFARVADLEKRLGLNDESQKTLSLAPTITVQERFKSNPTVSDSSGTDNLKNDSLDKAVTSSDDTDGAAGDSSFNSAMTSAHDESTVLDDNNDDDESTHGCLLNKMNDGNLNSQGANKKITIQQKEKKDMQQSNICMY